MAAFLTVRCTDLFSGSLLFIGFLKQKGCGRSFISLFIVRCFLKHFKALNFLELVVLYPHLSSVACYSQGNSTQCTLSVLLWDCVWFLWDEN